MMTTMFVLPLVTANGTPISTTTGAGDANMIVRVAMTLSSTTRSKVCETSRRPTSPTTNVAAMVTSVSSNVVSV